MKPVRWPRRFSCIFYAALAALLVYIDLGDAPAGADDVAGFVMRRAIASMAVALCLALALECVLKPHRWLRVGIGIVQSFFAAVLSAIALTSIFQFGRSKGGPIADATLLLGILGLSVAFLMTGIRRLRSQP